MTTTIVTAEPGVPFIEISREFDAPRDLRLPRPHRSRAAVRSGWDRAGSR